MKKAIGLITIVMALGLGWAAHVTHAQTDPNPPPTIVTFYTRIDPVTVPMAEAGGAEFAIAWHVIYVSAEHRLALDMYRGREWVSLLEEGEELPAVGARSVTLSHPLNFGPPTYRLSIVDAEGEVLDERTLVVPYDLQSMDLPPAIQSFTAEAQSVDAAALADGSVRVAVTWQVAHRRPTTNLVFTQVLPDGSAVSVELPRDNYWVVSTGRGVVAPITPGTGEAVRLRLQVVDVISGEVFDAQEITLDVAGAQPAPAPPDATGGATETGAPQVAYFTASPETTAPGGTVTLSWETHNAQQLWIEQFNADRVGAGFTPHTPADVLYSDLPLSGSLTVTLTDDYTDGHVATFILVMDEYDVDARGPGDRVDVPIVCPHTFFFEGGAGCPAGPAQDIAAAYQPFEHGYMLWRSDKGEVYIHHEDGSAAYYMQSILDTLADNPVTDEPPVNLYKPVGGFGRVWGNFEEVRTQMGWATAPEQGYTMRVQTVAPPVPLFLYYLTLPEGQVVGTGLGRWAFE